MSDYFDLESLEIINNAESHYEKTQTSIIMCLAWIDDIRLRIRFETDPARSEDLEKGIDYQIDKMLSLYNQLLCLEYIDDMMDGHLLSNSYF